MAPTAADEQPWTFTVVRTSTLDRISDGAKTQRQRRWPAILMPIVFGSASQNRTSASSATRPRSCRYPPRPGGLGLSMRCARVLASVEGTSAPRRPSAKSCAFHDIRLFGPLGDRAEIPQPKRVDRGRGFSRGARRIKLRRPMRRFAEQPDLRVRETVEMGVDFARICEASSPTAESTCPAMTRSSSSPVRGETFCAPTLRSAFAARKSRIS